MWRSSSRTGTFASPPSGRRKTEHKNKDSYRSEFTYGSFTRTVKLPPGGTEADVTATYKDGVLEIRIPVAEPVTSGPSKIEVTRG